MRSSTSIVIASGPVFICQTLAQHREGGFITARGYRSAKTRPIVTRRLRDCELIPIMMDIDRDNYSAYGVLKCGTP